MPASPSTLNYYIGKGTITFQPTGVTAARDLGNVPTFEFTPAIEKLDHFSSRSGIRSKDRSVIVSRGGTIRLVMEEFTAENLALAMGGTVTTTTAGTKSITILDTDAVEGELIFTGTNDVGQKIKATFPKVSFAAAGTVGLISDEWGQIEIEGEVLEDTVDGFGTFVFTDAS